VEKMTKARGYTIRPDGKKDTGRPTKLTPETITKLETAFSLGCSDVEACLYADISKTALYNYQNNNPEFVNRKEMLKDKLIFKSRTVIAEALNNGDKDMAKWYLERKKKSEFATRQELTGEDGESLTPVINILPIEVKNGNSSDTE
jgi:hypothetical protein